MWADVTGGAVIGTAHLVLFVALLAIFPRHDTAYLGRLMFGNIATMATGTRQRRIPMGAVLRRMANTALAHGMVPRCRDLARRADMHQSPVAVCALLFIML